MEPEKIEKKEYKITKGANGKWNKGSNQGLEFISDGDYNKFREIRVDGIKIDQKYYTAKAGSTIVTLKETFLNTLDKGDHTLTLVFEDGEVETKFTISGTEILPKTGEASPIIMVLGFMLLLSGIFLYRKKGAW